jgi:hypothetical protein
MSLNTNKTKRTKLKNKTFNKSPKKANTKRPTNTTITGKKSHLMSSHLKKISRITSNPLYDDSWKLKKPKPNKNSKTSTSKTKCSAGPKPPHSSTSKSSVSLKVTGVSTTIISLNTLRNPSSKNASKSQNSIWILKGPKQRSDLQWEM